MAKKSPFPTDDTVSDAADRGEAVLALYRKRGGFDDLAHDDVLTLAIQDIAIYYYTGDCTAASPEMICESAAVRARDLITDEEDYDEELDCGSVTLAGEQARALVLAAADSLRLGGLDETTKARLIAAVEAINGTFRLGVENA
jgi:hypothetical protein